MSESPHWSRVVVVSTVAPPPGGIATHTADLVAQLRRNGVDVTVVAPRRPGDSAMRDGTRTLISPWRLRSRDYVSLIDELRPQAVIVQFSIPLYHSCIPAVIALMRAARAAGIVVLTLFHEPTRELRMLGGVGRWIYRLVLGATSVPVALSAPGADALRTVATNSRELFLGVAPMADPSPDDLDRAHAMLGSTGPVVMLLGFIHPHKGSHFVLEAAKELLADLPDDAIIVVAGSRKERHGLLRLMGRGDRLYERRLHDSARERWPSGRVRFVPYVDDDLLPAVLACSTVVVLPYSDTTQSAVASLCVAARRPVVASRVPGLASLDGAAVYCDPSDPRELADAIARVVRDPALQKELASAAAALADEQSFARLAESLETTWIDATSSAT